MNFRILAKILGLLLLLQSVAMLFCLLFTHLDHGAAAKSAAEALLISAGLTAIAGILLVLMGMGKVQKIPRREGVVIVGLGWILSGIFGAIPYMLCEPRLAPAAAIFESVSGFTTTGSTVMTNIESWPRGLLMWRSITQWLGGLGILVLFVAVLSAMGVGGKNLFRNESSMATGEVSTARIRDTALTLWRLYIGFTILCTVVLHVMGLTWFNSVCHAFTAVSTGGFSPHNASIGYYSSWGNGWLIEGWLMIIMLACSVNFLIWSVIIRKRWKRLRDEEEGLTLFVIFGLTTAAITVSLVVNGVVEDGWEGFRQASFNVASLISTTGYGTADFETWPTFCLLLIASLMILGGCSGSTAGGLKVSRLLVLLKTARFSVVKSFRPNQVFRMKLNGQPVKDDFQQNVIVFVALFGVIILGSSVVMSLLEPSIDMETAVGAVLATLPNIGPGFGDVGPTDNFGWFKPGTQIFLSLLMILGRLELYAVLVLFVPSLWRRY